MSSNVCLPVIGGLEEQSASCLVSLDTESKRGNYSAIWRVFPPAGNGKVVTDCWRLLDTQSCFFFFLLEWEPSMPQSLVRPQIVFWLQQFQRL